MNLLASGLVLSADAPVDLQLHTTYSDGTWSPEELIDYLVAEQFGLIAVTDHDNLEGVPLLQQLGARKGLPVLAAVEMSTTWRGEATDLLCYGFDTIDNELAALARSVVSRQEEITISVHEELRLKGYRLPPHEHTVIEKGRPLQHNDISQLLLEQGYSTGPGSIGKIMTDAGFDFATNDLGVVVSAAHRSGAVCLIAHPGRGVDFTLFDEALLDELQQEIPIDGIEAYYPLHKPEQTTMYLAYAQKHGLLVSSGSDSHGPEKKPVKYPARLSRNLLERLAIRVEQQ